jgi:hypothetical protein
MYTMITRIYINTMGSLKNKNINVNFLHMRYVVEHRTTFVYK